jgi:hypothetical protein
MTHQIENRIVAFTMPKPLENDEDNQDAFCVNQSGTMVAIADGASTGYRQKEWAKFLVEYFCKDESSIEKIRDNYIEWLKEPQQKWRDFSLQIQSDPYTPWNQRAVDNRDHGAATFVGIKIDPYDQSLNQGIWHAAAVGDSCLFHITQDCSKLRLIPSAIKNSKDFNTTPLVIRSLPEKQSSQIEVYLNNSYSKGDFFLLATDALAKWILESYQNGGRKWQELLTLDRKEDFFSFVKDIRALRSIPKIDIDDTTLCVIRTGVTQVVSTGQVNTTTKVSANDSLSNPIPLVPQATATNLNVDLTVSNNSQTPTDNKDLDTGNKNKPTSANNFDMKFAFRLLAFIGVLNLIPSVLNLLVNLMIVGWITPILGFSKTHTGNTSQNSSVNNPKDTRDSSEAAKSRVTSIEGIAVYKSDINPNTQNLSPQPVGFLFNNAGDISREPEIEVFIPTQFEYISNESNIVSLKNNQVLPICKTLPLPTSKSPLELCKDNIGYILPNSGLIVENPTDSPTIYKNGRVVKARLKVYQK